MAPLCLEAYKQNQWVLVSIIRPRDLSGSISHNKDDGTRNIYMFVCASDDSKSVIYRSGGGIDTEIGQLRETLTTGLEVVKELRKGDEPYQMTIKTDKSPQPKLIRFSHFAAENHQL